MIWLLAVSLFFNDPVVPDLPRASAFLEENDAGAPCLVDRYDVFDLWTAQRVAGTWTDSGGRRFQLAVLDRTLPPDLDGPDESRVEFEKEAAAFKPDDLKELARSVQALVPYPIAEIDDWTKPHVVPRTCREVRYCEGTNDHLIVAAYLPEKSARWQLAVWELAETDDTEECRKTFEDKFLATRAWRGKVAHEPDAHPRRPRKAKALSERELLRRDLVHSVTNYPAWRVTDSPGYVILDEQVGSAEFIARLTNELVAIRADYAKAVPSPVDGSNTLAVARLYADRTDYLRAAGPEMDWSAAYWCQSRREIVAYLPGGEEERLVRTLRHEGFHQYLSYAGSMVAAAPWINEGYAEYFEMDEAETEKRLRRLQALAVSKPDQIKACLVSVFAIDYDDFYCDDPVRCSLNYMMAWSIAYFIEKGAPDVRFQPFAKLTGDYMKALLKTRDRTKATQAVFTEDLFKAFVSEWLKFYRDL